jgi:conjugative transfer signal peptidase TraF
VRGLFALLGCLLLVAMSAHWYGLSLNVTDSMPIGFYHFERQRAPIARGTIVQACLPATIAAVGRQRGYLLGGSCPDGAAPVLKIVAATGGDRIELLERQIIINGRALPGSGTAMRDARGRLLAHLPRGTFSLAHGDLWLWTPNPASWDSRYYGPVSERQVLGRAMLLLPLGRWRFAAIRT